MAESKKLTNNEEDNLSLLPDDILVDILSRIPTNIAASTSVLSHRWRNLWTAVTRFELFSESIAIVHHILGQLTSPKLTEFKLGLYGRHHHDALESCFSRVCDRHLEKVSLYANNLPVPISLFRSQFLVVLELGDYLSFDFEFPEIADVIHLPNLKKLDIIFSVDVPHCLGTLIRSCPLLEDLDLMFLLRYDNPMMDCVDIVGLNLRSLNIELYDGNYGPDRTKISIDAPKLTDLVIRDCYSHYYFVHNPSTLVNACIDLRDLEEKDGDELVVEQFLDRMSMFVKQMSCASKFDLKLTTRSNILTLLSCGDDGSLPIFPNLTHLEITLWGIILSGACKESPLSLQCFPNLKHLKVTMTRLFAPTENNNWCPPDHAPDCLVKSLKTIEIWEMEGIEDDLKLLGYILCNVTHLEELHIHKLGAYWKKELLKESQFCKSLFRIPRISSTCEVVFSGWYITASSSTFKDGYITCQMCLDD